MPACVESLQHLPGSAIDQLDGRLAGRIFLPQSRLFGRKRAGIEVKYHEQAVRAQFSANKPLVMTGSNVLDQSFLR